MNDAPSMIVNVEIFGAVYSLRSDKGLDYLQDLAQTVDRRMREIAERVSTVDTAKIAILAALNLADELVREREEIEGERVEIREKIAELTSELTGTLEGA